MTVWVFLLGLTMGAGIGEDERGDLVEILTYCSLHAPNIHNAWPCYAHEAFCQTCGIELREGSL